MKSRRWEGVSMRLANRHWVQATGQVREYFVKGWDIMGIQICLLEIQLLEF